MNAKELGIFTRCQELKLDYGGFRKLAGAHEMIEASPDSIAKRRELAATVGGIMAITGKGHTKAAQHLASVVTTEGWDNHKQEVTDLLYDYLAGSEHVKQAASMLIPAGLAGAKGVALLAALTGAGVGALYWQLKRDSQKESSKAETIKSQIAYYDQLSTDLENKMTEKYEYADE
jgi:hypothetical protein